MTTPWIDRHRPAINGRPLNDQATKDLFSYVLVELDETREILRQVAETQRRLGEMQESMNERLAKIEKMIDTARWGAAFVGLALVAKQYGIVFPF